MALQDRSPALSATPDTSLPATNTTVTGDRVAITEEEVFSEPQLALIEKMIDVCRSAVRVVMLGADKATERDRKAYGILVQTNVIDDAMDQKTKRQVIGVFWSTLEHIRSRQGVDNETVGFVRSIHEVLFIVNDLP